MLLSVTSGFILAFIAPWLVSRTGRAAGWVIALLPAGLAVYYGSFINTIAAGQTVRQSIPWVPSLGIDLSFYLDGLSMLFALIISSVGALIAIYANGYFAEHPHRERFYPILLAFMSSMLGIVLADDIVTLFIFWELTSVTSYLLIGFDHKKAEARSSALKALLVTSLGGQSLLAVSILMNLAAGTNELSELITRGDELRSHALYGAILTLVCLAAFTKSAQWPFHFWLPAAMSAPTPVSAYLHSATMVKAGVYLLARLSPALGDTAAWHAVLCGFAGVTMLLTAWLALQQTDMKLILAYSTVSVLATLIFMIGFGAEKAAGAMVVYLAAHSFYKGALFMTAGTIDHGTGTRDLAKVGKLARAMPLTAAGGFLAAISMAGLPPALGYIGKEMLLESAIGVETWNWIAAGAVTLAAVATVAVAGIAGLNPYWRRANEEPPHHPHEGSFGMWLGPIVLGIGGLAAGLAPGFLEGKLFNPAAGAIVGHEARLHLALWHGFNVPLVLSIVALTAGAAVYFAWPKVRQAGSALEPIAKRGPARGYDIALDGLTTVARGLTAALQTGLLRHYIRWAFMTMVALIVWVLLGNGAPSLHFDLGGIYFHEWVIAGLITAGWILSVRARTGLGAIIAMGIVGYAVALIFTLFGAPDLTITQFAIETLVIILFVLVIYKLPQLAKYTNRAGRITDFAVAGIVGTVVTVLMLAILDVPHVSRISPAFLALSVPEGHGHNVVNVILVDFRAMDTLGEITVLGIAAIGVFALHRLRLDRERIEGETGRRVARRDGDESDYDPTI